jgi:hypothetical protein
MPRTHYNVAVILGAVLFAATLIACIWDSVIRVSSPTQKEYAVYRALLPHIAEGSKKRIITTNRTSALAFQSTTAIPFQSRLN